MIAHGHRRHYMLLLAASFFWGTTGTQLTLLAAVLRQRGISEPVIAMILSSSSVSVVVAAMISGVLASRIGAVRTLVLGALISCAAIAALPFAVGSAPLAVLAKAGQGSALAFSHQPDNCSPNHERGRRIRFEPWPGSPR